MGVLAMPCQAGFRAPPYLIYPGETDQMWIVWHADSPSDLFDFSFGQDDTYQLGIQRVIPDDEGRCLVELNVLEEASRYCFRVTTDGESHQGTFITAPSESAPTATLYGVSDSHGVLSSVAADILGRITQLGGEPAIVLHGGDWINGPHGNALLPSSIDYFAPWDALLANCGQLLGHVPIVGCPGNHDVEAGTPMRSAQAWDAFKTYWPLPAGSGAYWSLEFGPVHIVVCDLYSPNDPDSEQYKWLERDLQQSMVRPWTIILMAEPWSSPHLEPLLAAYGVDLIVSGGCHCCAAYEGGLPVPKLVMTKSTVSLRTLVPECPSVSSFYEISVRGARLDITRFDAYGRAVWQEQVVQRVGDLARMQSGPVVAVESVDRSPENSLTPAGALQTTPEPESNTCAAPESDGQTTGVGGDESTPAEREDVQGQTHAGSPCHPIPLSAIEWVASINQDEDADTPGNHALLIQGSAEFGAYYGMEWNSPAYTDLSLNGIDRFDRAGARSVSLVLSASEAMDVEIVLGIGGDYCGQAWRNASAADSLHVGTEPGVFVVSYSEFSDNPFGSYRGPLPEDALEGLFSIYLLPAPREG